MNTEKRITPPMDSASAKLGNYKDLTRVLEYFRYTTGTTLDCMFSTGVLRNSVTWYVDDLISMGLLQCIYRMPDLHTGRIANYYSANPKLWKVRPIINFHYLFKEEEF